MRIVVITQARTGSTRLPAKVTREVLGRPLLAYHLERLKMIKQADEIVVATTGNPKDDIIVNIAEKAGVGWYRGSEDDVLSRYYEAATEYGAEVVVRVTSDCPLIDPEISGRVIQEYVDSFPRFDYVSNTLRRTYPRGLDTEVFSYEILREVNGKAKEPADREHVTRYIIRRPEIYRLGSVESETDLSFHRWTVDEEDDFRLIKLIIEHLYPEKPAFNMQDCLELFSRHPEWMEINAHVRQKET
ncbi:MAG TPA: acylneuraminate cytidylyltransferase [Syntrophothermus lipocalidus]|nr:acylneuraminate cytidylyltransferase [Syntrophothermus lipocalidus]